MISDSRPPEGWMTEWLKRKAPVHPRPEFRRALYERTLTEIRPRTTGSARWWLVQGAWQGWTPTLVLWGLAIAIWGHVWWRGFPVPPQTVTVVHGHPFLRVESSPSVPQRLATPSSLVQGNTVHAAGGPVTFTWPKIQLMLEDGGDLTLSKIAQSASQVELTHGTVTATVTPGTPFVVRTPLGEARAKGTQFSVRLVESGESHNGVGGIPEKKIGGQNMKQIMLVMVMAGVVEVSNGLGSVQVHATEAAQVQDATPPFRQTTGSPSSESISGHADGITLRAGNEPAGTWGFAEGRVTFNDTLFTGVQTQWWSNGQKALETTYREGRQDGTRFSWHPNGQKYSESVFREGELDGTQLYWHPHGQKYLEGIYREGKPDGSHVTWYPNGQKDREVPYRNGKRDGLLISWDKNGQIINETLYDQGVLVKTLKPEEFLTSGKSTPITLGAQLKSVSDGLTVTAITPLSPAARASLQVGDHLLTIEGQSVPKTVAAFLEQLATYAEGSRIKLLIDRKGTRRTLFLPWTR